MSEMSPNVSSRVKWSVFIGIYLVRFFCGVQMVWGNMSIYVQSHFRAKHGHFTEIGPWLLVSNNIGFNLFLFLGSLIGRKIGALTTIFLAMAIYNCSVFIGFFTVQHSYPALCVTFGVVTGICNGIIESNQYTLIVRWTEHYHAMATSTVPSLNIFGAVAINMIMTLYINPNNLEADLHEDHMTMFSQPEIIERVPYVFFLYGGISLSLNSVGFLLLRDRPGQDCVAVRIFITVKNFVSLEQPGEKSCLKEPSVDLEIESSSELENDSWNNSRALDDTGLSPKQILKTREFYALWLFIPILNFVFIVVNNYYKTFGLLYIPDDYFLASARTLNCFFTPPCALVLGYIMDKAGVKKTMLGATSLLCVVASFFYIAPMVNRWFFLVWLIVYGCIIFATFCSMSSCCLKLFGEAHFNTNYGLAYSSTYLVCVVTPPLVEYILSFGWMALFYSIAVLLFIGFFLNLVCLPANTRYKTL